MAWKFSDVTSIQIETSNICNWYCKKCPLSLRPKSRHLPMATIFSLFDDLAKLGFKENLTFHQYTEPLMDPRMFHIILTSMEKLPNCSRSIWTNGSLLTDELQRDFVPLKVQFVVGKDKSGMDDRLKIYEYPISEKNKKCSRTHQITVSCEGHVVACCYDWKRTISYGDLSKQSFIDIIQSEKFLKDRNNLCGGIRTNEICKRCLSWVERVILPE